MFSLSEQSSAAPIRVLLSDDHLVMRWGLRAIIEAMDGMEVCAEAASGPEAIELARRLRPEIVIMDMTLPGLNVLDATRQIKKLLPSVEILMFTNSDREELIFDVFEAGARSIIPKSSGLDHLQSALKALAKHQPYLTTEVSDLLLKNFLRKRKAPAPKPRSEALTTRERQIVQLLAEGKRNREVATTLGISIKTAEAHRASCMKKLNLNAFSDLVRYAIRNNLVAA